MWTSACLTVRRTSLQLGLVVWSTVQPDQRWHLQSETCNFIQNSIWRDSAVIKVVGTVFPVCFLNRALSGTNVMFWFSACVNTILTKGLSNWSPIWENWETFKRNSAQLSFVLYLIWLELKLTSGALSSQCSTSSSMFRNQTRLHKGPRHRLCFTAHSTSLERWRERMRGRACSDREWAC